MKRLVTLGSTSSPGKPRRYEDIAAVGRFEGDAFDPDARGNPRMPSGGVLCALGPTTISGRRAGSMAFSPDE